VSPCFSSSAHRIRGSIQPLVEPMFLIGLVTEQFGYIVDSYRDVPTDASRNRHGHVYGLLADIGNYRLEPHVDSRDGCIACSARGVQGHPSRSEKFFCSLHNIVDLTYLRCTGIVGNINAWTCCRHGFWF